MCDPQCGSGGCWGENDDQCLECSNQRLGKTCLQSCEHAENAYDAGNATCQLCHDQCQGGCTGPVSFVICLSYTVNMSNLSPAPV